jgi:hypothetical protein
VEEIAPGLWHWKALRESIGSEVSSYYLAAERVLVDPMIPPEGVGFANSGGLVFVDESAEQIASA